LAVDRTRLSIAFGVVGTAVLAVAAAGRHPQGNIGRAAPYVAAAAALWVAVSAVAAGGRAAVTTACALAAAGLAAVAVYALFIDPVSFAECGRLVEELNDPACRSHGPVGLVLAAAGGSVLATAGLVASRRKGQ